MAAGGVKRIRSIAPAPKTLWQRSMEAFNRPEFRLRLLLCAFAIILMFVVSNGWEPPFPYRLGQTIQRDLTARVDFVFDDEDETQAKRADAARSALTIYENDPQPLIEKQQQLLDRLIKWRTIEEFETFPVTELDEWKQFVTEGDLTKISDPDAMRKTLLLFKEDLAGDNGLNEVKKGVEAALKPYEQSGLLSVLQHKENQGSMVEILVVPKSGGPRKAFKTSELRIDEVATKLESRIYQSLDAKAFTAEVRNRLSKQIYAWLRPKLPETLKYSLTLSEQNQRDASEAVPMQRTKITEGAPIPYRGSGLSASYIQAGNRLNERMLDILKVEHRAFIGSLPIVQRLAYILAAFGMYTAMLLLCVIYLFYREPDFLDNTRAIAMQLGLAVLTIGLTVQVSRDGWRAELVPVIIYSVIVATTYRHELALIFSSVVSLIAAVAIGQGLPEFAVLVASSTAASFFCGSIKSRVRLIYVGFIAAAITFPTHIGVNVLSREPFSTDLITTAAWYAITTIIATVLVAALLPFLEKTFNIETDMRLLELGVASHPLLQSLVLRAPGTYNHSINVAALAEAAAKEIGANPLLCRIGAYFHDIGKMCKPEYFVENQSPGHNKHDSLNPAMSTLVIMAHVKDGVELAREHSLPQRIIDFIEQHHGTTLIAYFYDLAKKQAGEDSKLNEADFRYPGPKPQTKEAAVLMLADAVESASRTLIEPAPARIENLVRDISRSKLYDGQFDECSLTLKELRRIEIVLTKTVTAMFHARVRYPDAHQPQ